jgi:hypothetical protein
MFGQASVVFEFGELGIRRVEEKELPAAADHRGSSRKIRDAWLRGDIAGGSAPRLAGASRAVYDPGPRNRAPCRRLTADRFEASHCPAPVAGERQLRPRSHDHGHPVHSFIALPRHNVTFRDIPCSWLTRAAPPIWTGAGALPLAHRLAITG